MNNHAELSRDLALALGYYPESVSIETDINDYEHCFVYRIYYDQKHCEWRRFDYRSPDVAMPLLKWLMLKHSAHPRWNGKQFEVWGLWVDFGWTLEEAIARACIAVGVK